ncbi:hypothetical protein [Hymenobacter guriensis]|uniref:Nitrogen fixation protein FixH n=1 Tax=Hymenobacter guriensis TaxID=2793065 RepID=A0ABS0KXF2_9BACT|nr:hypothetical protein [Hymenobacter guriensis]MBG8552552.1 hypothetical protein [Hymenobacter guriensis]
MTKQDTTPEPNVVTGGCMFFFGLFLLVVGYLVFSSDSPVSPNAPPEHGFVVNGAERTYLYVAIEEHNGVDRPYSTAEIYYTRLGGWGRSTKRVNLGSVDIASPEDVTYERVSKPGKYPIQIHVGCEGCSGKTVTIPREFPEIEE